MMVTSRSSPSPARAARSLWRSRCIPTDNATPDVRSRFRPRTPLNLALTLGPIGPGPALRLGDREAWRATYTPEGPATVRLAHGDGGVVDVDAWGPGSAWAAQNAPVLCGEEDDDSDFHPREPALVDAYRRHPGLRITKTRAVFEALVPTVIGQKVQTVAAHASYRSLLYELGAPAPGPAKLQVPPPASVLAETPYWVFHKMGVERRRTDVIIRAARSARRLEETATMSLADAWQRLLAFPGVGPWTAAKVAMVALGDADAVPLGDYHLPHMVGYTFDGTPRSTDERMLAILEPYRGHRGRVLRLLTLTGASAPRFGPKLPLRDITHS